MQRRNSHDPSSHRQPRREADAGRHDAHLAPGVGEEAKRSRRSDRCVQLPKRAGGRVARVAKEPVAGRLLTLVERNELGLGHIDLAAHLADRSPNVPSQEPNGDIGERPDSTAVLLRSRTGMATTQDAAGANAIGIAPHRKLRQISQELTQTNARGVTLREH
jgi:hypothetical protein